MKSVLIRSNLCKPWLGNTITENVILDTNNNTFTGHRRDEDINLIHMGLRFMDPDIGRFISSDKARDGSNWYVYANNNPLKYVDPTGEFGVPWGAPSGFGDAMDQANKQISSQAYSSIESGLIKYNVHPYLRRLFMTTMVAPWASGIFGTEIEMIDLQLSHIKSFAAMSSGAPGKSQLLERIRESLLKSQVKGNKIIVIKV